MKTVDGKRLFGDSLKNGRTDRRNIQNADKNYYRKNI